MHAQGAHAPAALAAEFDRLCLTQDLLCVAKGGRGRGALGVRQDIGFAPGLTDGLDEGDGFQRVATG